jgi:hypothetical protein
MDKNFRKSTYPNKKPTLFLFNLRTDETSFKLAASIDWIKAFALECNEVYVFSTHVGKFTLPSNVHVTELGGGTFFGKIKWMLNTVKSIYVFSKTKENKIVLHYMSHYTVIFPGIIFKVLGARQGLWYAHGHKNKFLAISERITGVAFTSIEGAFPMRSKKIKVIGQGVNIKNFNMEHHSAQKTKKMGIVSLGRISPVKHLDVILLARIKPELIEFCGESPDSNYKKLLQNLAIENQQRLQIVDPILYSEVPRYLAQWRYYFCGTEVAVDKAAIEAALSGCIILSLNKNVLELTGMHTVYEFIGSEVPNSILEQFNLFESLNETTLISIETKLREECSQRNDVKKTTEKIILTLCESYKYNG